MAEIPWTADSALHLSRTGGVVLGNLSFCCQRFCEAPARDYAYAYIICQETVLLNGKQIKGRITGDDLVQLICNYMEVTLPADMARAASGPIGYAQYILRSLGNRLARQQIKRAAQYAQRNPHPPA